jgi:cyclase
MKKVLCLLVLAMAAATSSLAQQQRDFSKVEIKATKITDSFHAIEGEGGRIGVLVGADGILMVDSQFAQISDRILTAIRQISDKPIRFLINTHVHGDHVGGNANFAAQGATIMARPQLRARLISPAAPPGVKPLPPAPAQALPVLTYDQETVIHMNGEAVRLIPAPVAHTDGDTLVYFPKANVIMTGDFFRSVGFPNIDTVNGGSLPGLLASFETVLKLGPANAIIAPGHGPITDKAAVTKHRDMTLAVRDKVAALIKEGKTQDEVVAAKPAEQFQAQVGGIAFVADRFVIQLYQELKKAP